MAPRVVVATQKIVGTGLSVAMTAPTVDGDVMDAGAVDLIVTNGSGAPITVTIQTPATQSGLDVAENIVTVPAAGTKHIGPFAQSTYARPSAPDKGKVYVNYSAQASVTRGVVGF
jgi:hypothetical protein